MRTKIIIVIATSLLFSYCSNQDNKENRAFKDNMLLAKEVKASCYVIVDNEENAD